MAVPGPRPLPSKLLAGLGLAGLLLLPAGCRTTDDARVLQVLNQRGFGRPTQDANRQYYLGIGDQIRLRAPDFKEYDGQSEKIRMDGTVTLEDVDEVYLNGLTPEEASEAVRKRYAEYVKETEEFDVLVSAINSKRYYVTGVPPFKPRAVVFKGDTLLIDALSGQIGDENLVDTDAILVIRGDPENPLVIICDYDDVRFDGLTRDNILIRENDIIYLNPSVVGYLAWGVSLILSPLTPLQQLVTGSNNIVTTVDSFGEFSSLNNNKFKNQGGFQSF